MAEDFAEKYGLHVQIAVLLLLFFETLMVALLKAILVFYLRFEAQYTENRAILTYHLFKTIAYFSAFLNGLVAMQSVSASLVILMILYVISVGCLAAAFLTFSPGDLAMPFMVALFGLGHGALKSVIHRMLKVKVIGKAFVFMFFALLLFEVILMATLPGNVSMQKSISATLGLLGVVFILLLVSILGSLFDNHNYPDHKLSMVVSATYFGIISMIKEVQENTRNKIKRKKDAKKKVIINVTHWMDRCLGVYPKDLVLDLKAKFRLHKFYWGIAGLWIAVEMKYSYWIFNSYFTNRVIEADYVIQPPQYLALTPLVFLLFSPLFYFLIRPMLSKSFYYNSLRQMCLGAFIILAAAGLGWKLSAMQVELTTEFMEGNSSHQKVRLLNAYDCQSGFEYNFPMNPILTEIYKPMPALDVVRGKAKINKRLRKSLRLDPMPPTTRDRYVPQPVDMITNILLPTLDQSFLKYANVPFLDTDRSGDVLSASLSPTDSFTYLMSIDSLVDHSVTLSTYGTCEALDQYTLKIPLMNNKSQVDQMLVYMIHNRKTVYPASFHSVDFKRDLLQKPGVRVYGAFDVQQPRIDLARDGVIIASLRKVITKEAESSSISPIILLSPGDGHNLIIQTMGLKLQLNYTLGTAEMADILVATSDDGKVVVKLLSALRPITISGMAPVAQYVILPFGEFLFGIVGLQQLVALAPVRMRFSVYVDWYLMLGCSNLVIVIVTQMGMSLLHHQMTRLYFIVLVSFFLLLLMTARY